MDASDAFTEIVAALYEEDFEDLREEIEIVSDYIRKKEEEDNAKD